MKVIYGIGKVKQNVKTTSLAIGVFDGLHIGHQALISRAVKSAKAVGGISAVMTFFPHPVEILHPHMYVPSITSLPYRLFLIEKLGVDQCIVVDFTKRFSSLSPEKFVKSYLVKNIRPQEIFVGCDFLFGKERTGTLNYFKAAGQKYGFKVSVLHSVEKCQEKISSTSIRRLIGDGKLVKASKLLGRPVSIMGEVQKGDGRGRTLGYPTANLYLHGEIIPPLGVYAVEVLIDGKRHPAMANLGWRPSFNALKQDINLEVNIFNFSKNLRGKNIIVEFVKKTRNEKKFSLIEELIEQLKKDEKKIKKILLNNSNC